MSTGQIGHDFAAPGNRALALATILAAQLMLQMEFLIVIVALPRIQADLWFTPAGLSWVPNAFALAFGGLLLLGGRLGDMFGQVKAFQAGLAVFVLAPLFPGGLALATSGSFHASICRKRKISFPSELEIISDSGSGR